jgi:hypothetical protein
VTARHSDRAAHLVTRWVRRYTRRLPAPVAERRVDEILADLHDHIDHERAHGTGDRRIALSVLSRMVRGLPADASWRRRNQPRRHHMIKFVAMVAVGIAAIVFGGYDDAPGLQLAGLILIVLAVVLGVRAARKQSQH